MLFKGFDIPLQMLSAEKFEQPILFGANNLSGIVQTNIAYAGRRVTYWEALHIAGAKLLHVRLEIWNRYRIIDLHTLSS